jgi:formyl-CoA transferase/CoA:oxalate CoA-transferase
MLNHQVTGVLATGSAPVRMGSASPITAPYQAIRAADGHVMVAAGNDSLFARLAAAIGAPELAGDPRFSTVAARVANLPELVAELEARTSLQPVRRWVEVLGSAGVPCGPVNDLAEALRDPIVAEREVIVAVPGHPTVPDLRIVDLPFRVGGRPLAGHRPPPTLGQHTDEVLEELAQATTKESR